MADIQIVLDAVDNASSVLSDVGGAMLDLAGTAAKALGGALQDSVKEAMDAQRSQASLAQVIKSTGGAAGLTIDRANELAQQFADLAGGSDDAVTAIEEIGIRAGTVSADQMPNFIQTTLDLGKVMGSTTDAATLLARAQEDPVAAMNKAQRAGIVFSDSLKEQIKNLVKSGDTAGATALLMGRLSDATGGAAAADAETMAGKWEVLQGHLKKAEETIGTALLPVLQSLFDSVIAPAIPVVEDLAQQFGYVLQALTSGDTEGALYAFTEGFDILSNAFPQFAGGIGEVQSAFAQLPDALGQVQVFLEPLVNAFDTLWSAIQLQGPAVLAQLQDFFGWLMTNIEPVASQIRDNLANAIVALAQIWAAHGDEIMSVVKIVFEVIVATVAGALELLSGIITAALQALNGNWSGAWQTITDTFTGFMNMVLSIAGTDLPNFLATWSGIWNNIQTIVSAVLMNMTSGIQTWLINTINTIKSYYETFKELGTSLMNNVYLGIQQGVAQVINAVVGMVNSAMSAAGAALGGILGGGAATTGHVGGMAEGGIVTSPTLTWVGERGPEAVVPLSQLGSLGGPQSVTVQVDGDTLFQIMLNKGGENGLTMAPVM